MKTRLSLFLFFLLFAIAGSAQQQSDLILILDASNSMWGQIDGENKIVIARRSVGGLIDELPDDARVGLVAYGHRQEADCTDIEVLQQPATVDKGALKETINSINPKGRTPITDSIGAAVELARDSDSSAIVLISDGLETCGLDPCDAVRNAKSEGVPFLLHVVGFDVGNEDTSQLECMAQAGDGLFLSASNAAELSDALQSAYEKPVVPDGRLIVTATAEGELQDAVVNVTDPATGENVAGGRTYASPETNPRHVPLEDGSYNVTVSAVGIRGGPRHEFEIEIVDGNRIEREFDFTAGEITVRVTRNGAMSDATVNVVVPGERTNVAGGRTYRAATSNPIVMRVAAGTYDVRIKSVELRNAEEIRFRGVVVTGNERTELNHEYTSGDLRIGTRRGDALVDSVVGVIDAGGRSIGGGRTYTSPSSNPMTVIVSPGEYTVRIRELRGEERSIPITVSAGETTELLVDLDQQ